VWRFSKTALGGAQTRSLRAGCYSSILSKLLSKAPSPKLRLRDSVPETPSRLQWTGCLRTSESLFCGHPSLSSADFRVALSRTSESLFRGRPSLSSADVRFSLARTSESLFCGHPSLSSADFRVALSRTSESILADVRVSLPLTSESLFRGRPSLSSADIQTCAFSPAQLHNSVLLVASESSTCPGARRRPFSAEGDSGAEGRLTARAAIQAVRAGGRAVFGVTGLARREGRWGMGG
jgi:hypothetical protein